MANRPREHRQGFTQRLWPRWELSWASCILSRVGEVRPHGEHSNSPCSPFKRILGREVGACWAEAAGWLGSWRPLVALSHLHFADGSELLVGGDPGVPSGCRGLSRVAEGATGLDASWTHCATLDKLLNTTRPNCQGRLEQKGPWSLLLYLGEGYFLCQEDLSPRLSPPARGPGSWRSASHCFRSPPLPPACLLAAPPTGDPQRHQVATGQAEGKLEFRFSLSAAPALPLGPFSAPPASTIQSSH